MTTEKRIGLSLLALTLLMLAGAAGAEDGRRVLARGAESYGPVTPIRTVALRDLPQVAAWQPGDPIKEVPRRFFPLPGQERQPAGEGWPDPLLDLPRGESFESRWVDAPVAGKGSHERGQRSPERRAPLRLPLHASLLRRSPAADPDVTLSSPARRLAQQSVQDLVEGVHPLSPEQPLPGQHGAEGEPLAATGPVA